MDIPVLYEDKDIVVVNKPAGLVVHSDGRTEEPTLVDWIMKKYPDIDASVGEPYTTQTGEVLQRPGIVHRLDRETSGVLLIAKHQKSFEHFKELFQTREIQKTYHAFVYGEVKELEGTIDRPIGKSRKDFRMWSAQRGARGELRDAVTDFKLLQSTEGRHQDGFSYLELKPHTGRTHQIRVHLKAINHPVVCDTLYAPKRKKALGFKRLALHASKIVFPNLKGKEVIIEAPLPDDFMAGLKKFTALLPKK